MRLNDLEIYRLSRQLSKVSWTIYTALDQQNKFHIGSQFIRSVDSIGANIAEGFGRFHFLDSVKFYYNARGSLSESIYWNDLLHERNLISKEVFEQNAAQFVELQIKLNKFITKLKERTN